MDRAETRLLVVDDDADFARYLVEALRPFGFEVSLARSGTEGVAAIARQQPDLVFLDLMLPGLDGFQVLERIDAAVPVIVVTSADLTTAEVQRLSTRTLAVLQKGRLNRQTLTEAIRKWKST